LPRKPKLIPPINATFDQVIDSIVNSRNKFIENNIEKFKIKKNNKKEKEKNE